MTPYQYTYQNPIRYTDPTGMLPEDGGGDPEPPTGKRDIYDSTPTKDGGRKLTKTKTVSSGSDQNDAFVNVKNDKGETTEAFTGSNAVANYSAKYGLPDSVETIMSDGKNGVERTLLSIGDVTYIAFTNTESSTVILAPLDAILVGKLIGSFRLASASKEGFDVARGLASAVESSGKGGLTPAGRAIKKHDNILRLVTSENITTNAQRNKYGAEALKYLMENGTRSVKNTSSFGKVVEYKMPSGLGARFRVSDNKFVGFLGRGL